MWKQRGRRSSALDRAEVLLSAKRSGRGDGGGLGLSQEPLTRLSVGQPAKARSALSNSQALLSDLSDVSSVSSVAEPDPLTVILAMTATHQGGQVVHSDQDARPQSSVGGHSRFIKKPPAPSSSSQSPVSRIQSQQQSETRYVSFSQTAALRRLAEIESRVHSRKQDQDQTRRGTKAALTLASNVPPPAAPRSPEGPLQFYADSSGSQSPRGSRFLKKKRAEAAPAAGIGVRLRSANTAAPSGCVQRMKVMSSVSLESDEEDMRRLLGASEESSDCSVSGPERTSHAKKLHECCCSNTPESNERVVMTTCRKPDNEQLIGTRCVGEVDQSEEIIAPPSLTQTSSRGDQLLPSPPPAAPPPPPLGPSWPSSAASPRPPRSLPRRDSPFRFTGQAQAHFSPSALSPSPPLSPVARPGPPPHRAHSPQRSLSSASGLVQVLSLEELFPVGPGSQGPHSLISSVSEDFKSDVMTLDDLVPVTQEFTAETPSKKRGSKHTVSASASEDEEFQYPSDFESKSGSAASHSDSLVSEHLPREGGEKEEVSEISEERSDASCVRTEEDYSSAFSDPGRSDTSSVSDRSGTPCSRSRSASHGEQRRRRASPKRTFKEAAVQTQSDPLAGAGAAGLDSEPDRTPTDPTPVLTYTLSAETVEALSSFNPALFALHEMLQQQLASTRSFIQSRRHLHTHLLQSLEPQNYRYTTLEDTKKLIQRHRGPKLSLEEALEEVLHEMRDCHCT